MKMIVTYELPDDERATYELMDSQNASFAVTDEWLSIVGDNTGRVYFMCPRSRVISARER
jgi:hypothetical protein